MSVASPPAIRVVGLRKSYGSLVAVNGIDFEVAVGEVFGLLGPNGAGKTTTVEILEGYRRPDVGTVSVLGCDPIRDAVRLRPRMGVMLQEGGLYPGLTPREVLDLFSNYYEDPEDPDDLLTVVGLESSQQTPVRRLSGGSRQKLSLAAALMGKPEILFLDEPTGGMDPHARATTWELLRERSARGTTVVLTTHAMDEAEQLCDRVAIMAGGRLAAIGTPHELTQQVDVAELWFATAPGLDSSTLARVMETSPDAVSEERPGEYLVRVPATPARIAALANFLAERDLTLRALHAGRRSLEDVFLQITAEEPA